MCRIRKIFFVFIFNIIKYFFIIDIIISIIIIVVVYYYFSYLSGAKSCGWKAYYHPSLWSGLPGHSSWTYIYIHNIIILFQIRFRFSLNKLFNLKFVFCFFYYFIYSVRMRLRACYTSKGSHRMLKSATCTKTHFSLETFWLKL